MNSSAPENAGDRDFWARARTLVGLSCALTSILVIVMAALLSPAGRIGSQQADATARTPYVLLQMNLCLSGRARCFERAHYPLDLLEAQTRIVDSHADAVTLNEVCRGDVREIAQATGYHLRFTAVTYQGAPLPCSSPAGRGLFGVAVLTRAGITSSVDDAYAIQDEVEQRRWICATTHDAVTVCATHLDVRTSSSTETVNTAQCAEFAEVLEGFEHDAPLIAAGDMNHWESCAPDGMWTRGDDQAMQSPGVQHVYGDTHFSRPTAVVVPMEYSDHDALVVTSLLAR